MDFSIQNNTKSEKIQHISERKCIKKLMGM